MNQEQTVGDEQQAGEATAESRERVERMRWHAVYLQAEEPDCDSDTPDVRVETRKYKADIEHFITALPPEAYLLYVFQGHRVEFKPRRVYDLGDRVAPEPT